MKSHSRSGGTWALGVLLAAVVLYPVSFGPVCWFDARSLSRLEAGADIRPVLMRIYWPILAGAKHSRRMRGVVENYARLGVRDAYMFHVYEGGGGRHQPGVRACYFWHASPNSRSGVPF